MSWKSGGSLFGDVVDCIFRLAPNVQKDKKTCKALVGIKSAFEDMDWDGFWDFYDDDPKLWDAILRAGGAKEEADEFIARAKEIEEE